MPLRRKLGALAASAALVVTTAFAGAPAAHAASRTIDGCTVTANKPTWDATNRLLKWSVNSSCQNSGMYEMRVTVWEDDPINDDKMFTSNMMGWLSYGSMRVSGSGKIWSTEVGNEEIYVVVGFRVKKGGAWRTVSSDVLSVNI